MAEDAFATYFENKGKKKVHELKWSVEPVKEGEKEGWSSYKDVLKWSTECGSFDILRLTSGENEEVKWSSCVYDDEGAYTWVESSSLGKGHPRFYDDITQALISVENYYRQREGIKPEDLHTNKVDVIKRAVELGLAPESGKVSVPNEKPKEKRKVTPYAERKKRNIERDKFGSKVGTQGSAMNVALEEEWKREGVARPDVIAKKLRYEIGRVRAHMLWLQNKGFGMKKDGGFVFNEQVDKVNDPESDTER